MTATAIRPAQTADLEAVAPLALALAHQHIAYSPRRFQLAPFAGPASIAGTYRDFFAAQLALPGVVLLVATDADARVVGYAFGRLEEASLLGLCPASAWLHDIYLAPDARGHGLGRRLLDEALAHLRALGADLLMLSASPCNESARQLFRDRGFVPTMIEHTLLAGTPAPAAASAPASPLTTPGASPAPTLVPVTTDEQVDPLLGFIEAYYRHDGIDFDAATVRRAVHDLWAHPDLGQAWLVHWQGRAVGHLVLAYGFDLEFGGRQATLTELFLEPGSRRRGLGRAVLHLVEQTLRQLGIGTLELQVERANTTARSFYASLGFRAHDRIPLSKHLG